jgi:hypothetical protein
LAPKILRLVSTDIIEPFAYKFNLVFASGKIPQVLKIAKVIPIFKGEKDKPGNYRPILLLSIFDKIFEKLFKRLYGF